MSDTTKSPSVTIDIGSPIQNNNNTIEQKVKLSWNDQTETLLRSWGDISSCYNWMHDKSFRKYQKFMDNDKGQLWLAAQREARAVQPKQAVG